MIYEDLRPGCTIYSKYGLTEREVLHIGTHSVTVRASGNGTHHDYEIPRHVVEQLWEIKTGGK